jgi:hypothetical protein
MHVQFEEGEGDTEVSRGCIFRHGWGNPDIRFAVTYTCPYPLSTLPADGTLAQEGLRGRIDLALARHSRGLGKASPRFVCKA